MKIEMFGSLIQELDYWNYICDHEEGEAQLVYADQMFHDILSAVKEMREILLEELNEYKKHCRTNSIPIDISYHRIQKQLEESTFSLVRG
jgi:hypothetical protein